MCLANDMQRIETKKNASKRNERVLICSALLQVYDEENMVLWNRLLKITKVI